MSPSQRLTSFLPFLRYCFVGGIGTGIDFVLYLGFIHFLGFPILLSGVLSAVVAAGNNFLLNKKWTFKNTSQNYRVLLIKFGIVSGIALCCTFFLLAIFLSLNIHYVLAKALTSMIVLVWNFSANKYWTFRSRERNIDIPVRYTYRVSIIIPAYNEAKRITKTLHSVSEYFSQKNISAEILVVDDGSTDNTKESVLLLSKKIRNIRVLSLPKNKGKGSAVRVGVENAQGEYILFIDADGATPISEWEKLSPYIQAHEVVIGSRYLTSDSVQKQQSVLRQWIGRFGNRLIQFFLLESIVDTQCGFKLFTHRSAKQIFIRQKVCRFGFDAEVLVIAKMLGYSIHEAPVLWSHQEGSQFRPIRDALRTFLDLFLIKLNLWSGRYE